MTLINITLTDSEVACLEHMSRFILAIAKEGKQLSGIADHGDVYSIMMKAIASRQSREEELR